MKILFYSWEYPPNGTGVASYVHNMARALVCSGHEVIVVTGKADGCKGDCFEQGVRVVRAYDKDGVGVRVIAEQVLKIARSEHVDVIEGADHLGECAELLDMPDRPPVMIKLHSCNAMDVLVNSQLLYGWQKLTVKASLFLARDQIRRELKCIKDADVVVAPSQRLSDEIIKQGLRSEVSVLPNPMMVPEKVDAQEGELPEILFAGRLDIGKGIQYLPGLMKRVLKTHKRARLTIAGSDSYARGLGSLQKWLTRQIGSDLENVKFCGHLTRDELDAAYRRAWVVVVPSRWDNFPGAVLEAMAWGKAIVASPNGGMPEMLENTYSVIADPSSDAFAGCVNMFLDDSKKRRLAGESGFARVVEEYSPEKMARQYISLLERTL